ncbi:hypothetical protein QJS66_12660 [Kocuria rhizophila]|nr:hypothetical protein QJS66_12660 [Kocuria rhizophila]
MLAMATMAPAVYGIKSSPPAAPLHGLLLITAGALCGAPVGAATGGRGLPMLDLRSSAAPASPAAFKHGLQRGAVWVPVFFTQYLQLVDGRDPMTLGPADDPRPGAFHPRRAGAERISRLVGVRTAAVVLGLSCRGGRVLRGRVHRPAGIGARARGLHRDERRHRAGDHAVHGPRRSRRGARPAPASARPDGRPGAGDSAPPCWWAATTAFYQAHLDLPAAGELDSAQAAHEKCSAGRWTWPR